MKSFGVHLIFSLLPSSDVFLSIPTFPASSSAGSESKELHPL